MILGVMNTLILCFVALYVDVIGKHVSSIATRQFIMLQTQIVIRYSYHWEKRKC